MQAQDWERASHEWQRYLLYIGPSRQANALMSLADCQLALQQHDAAHQTYRQAYRLSPAGSAERDTVALRTAFSAMLAARYNDGLAMLQEHAQSWVNPGLQQEGALLKAILLNFQGSFAESHTVLLEEWKPESDAMRIRIDSAYAKPIKYKPKKAGTALVLSVVLPGSGQAYAGRPGEGVLSLAMAGGTAALGVFSFIQGHYFFTFMTCLPFFQKFYEGGARYAMKRADQWNENRKIKLAQNLNDWIIVTLSP